MGHIGIGVCDMCGKRTEKFKGKLVLFAYQKRPNQDYTSQVTSRSWTLCQKCLNKLENTQSIGDKIKEEIEVKLDKLRVENKEIHFLE